MNAKLFVAFPYLLNEGDPGYVVDLLLDVELAEKILVLGLGGEG